MAKLRLPFLYGFAAFSNYGLLWLLGRLRDFFGWLLGLHVPPLKGYAPLVDRSSEFFTRRFYSRLHDCFNRPIASCPGAWVDVMLRAPKQSPTTWTKKYYCPLVLTGEVRRCFNLGSYNYLGFGDPNSTTKPDVLKALDMYGVTTGSNRTSLGTTPLHLELEKLVAEFVGKESSMVFGMGYGTNSTGIPALIGKDGLIISDSMNHASIVTGARSSGAKISTFKHNDVEDLERVIKDAIVEGQPRTRRPWKKILIIVEGIYSMEGEMAPLKQIVAIKKKYKCYLYVDEAHSIGAIGATGRGICEQSGVNPADVDIMMGTFTKSFGAVGGYIAADRQIIDYLRTICGGSTYSASISPPATQQAISAINIMMGRDGTKIGKTKINQLRENANYFRAQLKKMGCHVLGEEDSPVVPMLIYEPAKLAAFSRHCLSDGIAVVVVGYPACPLPFTRCRFCISGGYTKKDLDPILEKLRLITSEVGLRYSKTWPVCIQSFAVLSVTLSCILGSALLFTAGTL